MKKECEHTRKMLRRYRRGHVFATDRKRIERHLKACPVCNSEYQALKRTVETQELLRDITPPEGVAQRVRAGVSTFGKARKLFYRPLWIAALVALVWVVYAYVLPSLLHDRDLENYGMHAPALVTAPTASPAPASAASPTVPAVAVKQPEQPAAKPAPTAQNVKPLMVTITVENEQVAMKKINAVMKGHALLRTMRFTDAMKEVSGSLTARELLTFFGRIESTGKITYSQARLEAFPAAQALPFVLRLKAAPRAVPAERPVEKPRQEAAGVTADKPAAAPAPQAAPVQ